MTRLYVAGLPNEMDEMQLAQLFDPYGDIDVMSIVRDKMTRKSKGYAFVHMKTESGAAEAIKALDGLTMGERQLEVRPAEDKKPAFGGGKKNFSRPGGGNSRSSSGGGDSSPFKKKRPRLSR